MPLITELQVWPIGAQVALLDATWQDYPDWDLTGGDVAYRAESLIHPDEPPYPGFAVATRPHLVDGSPRTVAVELWLGDYPPRLRSVHRSLLAIGRAGVVLGNEDSGLVQVDLATGTYSIAIGADGSDRADVARVAFAINPYIP